MTTRHGIGLDEVVDHFTLDDEQLASLRNKTGATRLGFALSWRFLLWRGRFPRGRHEFPPDAVSHVARQVGVPANELESYDPGGRQASNHRSEIRRRTGFRPCAVADAEKLAAWLGAGVARDDRRPAYVRAVVLEHCYAERIEPPTSDRLARIVDSGIRQADQALIALATSRLAPEHVDRINRLAGLDEQISAPAAVATDVDRDDDGDRELLAQIKSSPGNVSLASMLTEIAKLEAVRAIGLPPALFAGVSPAVVAGWRARAAVESPSHLRAHDQPVRLVLLAALLHLRQREITDTLVELLNSIIHKINANAEKPSPRRSSASTNASATRTPCCTGSPRCPWTHPRTRCGK